jgi:hypothetical protein
MVAAQKIYADGYQTTVGPAGIAASGTSLPVVSATNAPTPNSGATPPIEFDLLLQSANYPSSGTREIVTVTSVSGTTFTLKSPGTVNAYVSGDIVANVVGSAWLNRQAAPSTHIASIVAGTSATGQSVTSGTVEGSAVDFAATYRAPLDVPTDVSNCQGRFFLAVSIALASASVKLQSSPDNTTWTDLAATTGDYTLSANAIAVLDSGWKAINSACAGHQFLRAVIFGNTATGSPSLRQATFQLRQM